MFGWAHSLLSSILLLVVGASSICRLDALAFARLTTSRTSIKKSELQYRGTSSSEDHYDVINESHVDIPLERRKLIQARHPCLAKHIFSTDANIRSTEDWFYNYLRIDASERKRFKKKLPVSNNGKSTIQRLGRHRLLQWFKFFLDDKAVGLSPKQLSKMVVTRPQLLSYKLSNIQATTLFFREEMGLSSRDFITILLSYPSVLMYSIDNRLRPTVDFLRNTLHCTEERVIRICISYPNVFSHSLDKTFLPKLAFFKELGLKRSEVSQVVAKFAPTLWLSEDNLRSKLDFLSESLNMTNLELRTVILTYPQILGLSIENNVTPKLQFFLDPTEFNGGQNDDGSNFVNCGLTKNELKEFVLYQPALLAYSLEGRLKPRIILMKNNNISFLYSPRNIMSYTDTKFQSWLASQTSSWSLVE